MTTHGTDPKAPQDMATLKKRYEELNKKKIRVEAEHASTERRLRELQRKARDTYDTDDLDQLRQKLADMTHENETRRAAYQTHLDDIEDKLAQVEANFAQQEQDDAS